MRDVLPLQALLLYMRHVWRYLGRHLSQVTSGCKKSQCDKRGVMTLLRKDPNEGYKVNNFVSITLVNADCKIFARVLAKMLVLVINNLVCHAQTFATPSKTIQNPPHIHSTS